MPDPDTPALKVVITLGCGCQAATRHALDDLEDDATDLVAAVIQAFHMDDVQRLICEDHESEADEMLSIVVTRGTWGGDGP